MAVFAAALSLPMAAAQSLATSRERGLEMLRDVKAEIKRYYYDPTFRGVNLDERFAAAERRVAEATSEGMISAIIAQAVLELGDSHTFFVPPPLSMKVRYGWAMQAVGDVCRIVAVRSGSAAETSGVRAGDLIVTVEGVRATRANIGNMRYSLDVLRPRTEVRMVLARKGQAAREVVVKSDIRPRSRVVQFEDYVSEILDRRERSPNRVAEVGDVFVWELGGFSATAGGIDPALKKLRSHRALVLDLRGNGGGRQDVLVKLAGVFTPGEVIGDIHERKGVETLKAADVRETFNGPVVVLIDSESGSASEMLARWLQIKGRAKVLGDRSAGAVMQSQFHQLRQGHDALFTYYGVSITRASLKMVDGSTLERVGVTPDEVVLPTEADLARGDDPVLARAVSAVGGSIDAAAAGKLFPRIWGEDR